MIKNYKQNKIITTTTKSRMLQPHLCLWGWGRSISRQNEQETRTVTIDCFSVLKISPAEKQSLRLCNNNCTYESWHLLGIHCVSQIFSYPKNVLGPFCYNWLLHFVDLICSLSCLKTSHCSRSGFSFFIEKIFCRLI